MKRTVMVLAMAGSLLAAMAWPASAKGEGQVGATITGPGLGGPGGSGAGTSGGSGSASGTSFSGPGAAVGTIQIAPAPALQPFQNSPVWRLANFTGAAGGCGACLGFIDTSPPRNRASLGPAYTVTYFVGKCCARSVSQTLYPYAPGGPWAHTLPHAGTRVWFMAESHFAWWHASGRMGQLFVRFLRHAGIPGTNPVVASAPGAAAATSTAGNAAAWRIPLAIGVLTLLLVAGAAMARPRTSARTA
jgi:hypothetical protein